jgi:putative membrane protein
LGESDASRLSSVKTEILVAWIFALILLIVWIIAFIFYLGTFFVVASAPYNPYIGAMVAGYYLIIGIIFFILAIPTILVFIHTNRMRNAANRGDLVQLKGLNSIGWAIVALIFSGVIPGVMLLVVHSPIESLSTKPPERRGGISTEDLDRLAKLKSLMDSKVISKEEFESQKNRILQTGKQEPSSVEVELSKLKTLYDSGAITEAEYNQQRKKLLSKI